MKCPSCNTKVKTTDSRLEPHNRVKRRKECPKCHLRFITHERIDYEHLGAFKREETV